MSTLRARAFMFHSEPPSNSWDDIDGSTPTAPEERGTSAIDITRQIFFDTRQSPIGSEAGMGGFGDVYIGIHASQGKVALKRPRVVDQDASAANSLRRLEREAVTWSQLSHEFVLPFLGMFRRNGQTYLVSPWIDGGHIRNAVQKNPSVDRFRLITEIASGLSYLHSKDIVHGDIKALNVLFSDHGHPLICDFGLSKVIQTMETSSSMKMAGSAQWLAPELWDNEPKTKKSDVYAFGMLMYEVLSGAPPFEGMNYGALYKHVCTSAQRPPKLPAQSMEGVSYAPLWKIAEKCWAKSPGTRPSMDEVNRRLTVLQGGLGTRRRFWTWLGVVRQFMRSVTGNQKPIMN